MNREEVFAQVGEDTRRSGRIPVDRLLHQLESERDKLLQEKRDIEVKLTQVEDWRRQETSRILMRRMDKTRSIEATTRLEAEARKKRAPLIIDKQTIEKRLHDIKTKLSRSGDKRQPREDVEILLRIEKLLILVIDKLSEHHK